MDAINYDEKRVPAYELPELLRMEDGSAVRDAEMWTQQRRAQLLALFAQQVYGQTPLQTLPMQVETLEREPALQGRAERRQLRLTFALATRCICCCGCRSAGRRRSSSASTSTAITARTRTLTSCGRPAQRWRAA